MRAVDGFLSCIKAMAVVTVIYVVCHGVTARIVAPVQGYFFSEITVFASVLYLPHGVRVLSTWLMGGRAAVPLVVGAFLSEWWFTEADIRALMQHMIWFSILVGALSAPVAFAILRLLGVLTQRDGARRMDWRRLLLAGMLASILNSIGQTVVFSGLMSPGHQLGVIVTYALGDMLGLVAAMLVLMLVFRALRHRAPQS
ncbi:hypothetical protein MHM88_07690 [Epibacterium sp. MM17-32]|uniref:hypothetical protein n=1 Tax=Epibacterium sp. MM17-32 TaxID=2917734 RepID=UPI001EF5B907|nr:hypothetical protein [Epibacterium sp. MM17-32]MCG7627682.1 hypothetical protein [Epibacterium sp. MM17-32]